VKAPRKPDDIHGRRRRPNSRPAPDNPRRTAALGQSERVSVSMLRANINSALSDVTGMLSTAKDVAKGATIAHIDVTLAIDVDGAVGLLGTGIHASMQGSLTVRLEFPPDADGKPAGA
jgi:hypothetical protein